jgi:hypothetical protein
MLGYQESKEPRRRFGEPAKFVPVLFLWCTIGTLYCVFVFLHLKPNLQLGIDPAKRDAALRSKAIFQTSVFHFLVALLVTCYVRSVLVHPGEVPDDDPQWEYLPQDVRAAPRENVTLSLQETKRSGDRRHCKWCGKYKPDRCHHCRVCKCCILKMDHHCPWLYNCVGFFNNKFFFHFIFYCVITLWYIAACMAPTIQGIVQVEMRFLHMFLLLFGETLSCSLGLLVTTFFTFHVWLMMKAMTTIEFCEKSMPKKSAEGSRDCWTVGKSTEATVYDLGLWGNIKAVLGNNLLLMLVPVSPPPGDGLNFVNEDTRLSKDIENSKGLRRKTHRRTQRNPPRAGYGTEYHSAFDSAYGQGVFSHVA